MGGDRAGRRRTPFGASALLLALVLTAGATAAVAGPAVTTPNDPLFLNAPACGAVQGCVNQQWNLMSDGRGISADTAWDVTRGLGAVVADIDTGVDFGHEDLQGQVWTNPGETGLDGQGHDRSSNGLDDDHNGYVDDWRGWDFYENDNDPTDDVAYGHGTGTTGIVVARQGNGLGISGVAPEARAMVLRASDTYIVTPTRLAQAIDYAVANGADVVTMSVGSIGTPGVLRQAVANAQAHGVVLVVATANEFSVHPNSPTFLDPVLGVGGIVPDTDGSGSNTASDFTVKAGFSNYGPVLDVVAPADVYTTDFGGGYGKMSGTSSATPGAAGVAALVVSRARALGLALSAREVVQVLRESADDLVGGPYGYAAGWDRYTGWGRVDAARAVAMVGPATIPPVADLTSPGWYQTVGGPAQVRGTVSARGGSYRWTLSVGSGDQPSSWTRLASGRGSAPFTGTLGTFDPAGAGNGLVTLWLQVRDAHGNLGEDRQAFVVQKDPGLRSGFPVDLASSVESSPRFADLDGNGRDELIVADQDGRVHAFTAGAAGAELPGWPVLERTLRLPGGAVRPGFTSSPAVADLNRDGRPDVVMGGLDGRIYAWNRAGRALPGWPVATRLPLGPDPANPHWESGIVGSVAVGEVDGSAADGPEVVAGAADGKVYALHSSGSALAGFPVLLDDPAQPGVLTRKIASSPAIGDIDGDGSDEIVIGDGETYGSTARVYALRSDGSYQPGWPVTLSGLQTDVTPVVAQGTPQGPVLLDTDGDGALEVAIAGVTTRMHLLKGDGTEVGFAPGGQSQYFSNFFGFQRDPNLTAPDARPTVSGLALGDLDRDGHPDLVSSLTDVRLFNQALHEGQVIPFQHLLTAWRTTPGGAMLPAFPRVIEDWMFLTTPVLADVDGDGKPEIVAGDGAGYVHAFRFDGAEPAGWPRYVGQWVQASAAAGDMDGDGRTDVALATRQGFVYVFSTNGAASGLDWPAQRGTPGNTGVFVEPGT